MRVYFLPKRPAGSLLDDWRHRNIHAGLCDLSSVRSRQEPKVSSYNFIRFSCERSAEIVSYVTPRVESVSCASGSDVISHQRSAEWSGTPEQWTSTCGESGTGPGVRQARCYTASRLCQGPCLMSVRVRTRSYRRDGMQLERRIWSWEKKKRDQTDL